MRQSTLVIETAARPGMGVVTDAQQKLLADAQDDDFGWVPLTEPGTYATTGISGGGQIEQAPPQDGAPQGTGYVLLRHSRNPDAVVVFTRDEWEAFENGIIAGRGHIVTGRQQTGGGDRSQQTEQAKGRQGI